MQSRTSNKKSTLRGDTLPTLPDEVQNKVGFWFDEENHIYYLDGKRMHGTTSVLQIVAKPMLIQWAANQVAEYIKTKCQLVKSEDTGNSYYLGLTVERLEEARKAHTKKKEDAGQKGTDIHSKVETLVKGAIQANGGLLNPDTKSDSPQVQKFIDWALENKVRFIDSEKSVFSRESWYAGTFDLVLEIDGKKYIADIKTSSGIYPEAYLQMAAYQNALEEMGEHEDIQGAAVINLDKKGGFEVGMNYDYEGNRLAFLAALTLYRQLKAISK